MTTEVIILTLSEGTLQKTVNFYNLTDYMHFQVFLKQTP